MSLLILLQKVPTEVKYSWGDTAKDIQNPRPSENQKKGRRKGGEKIAIWTLYELTELIPEQRSVIKTGQCQQVSSLADVSASALVNRSSMRMCLREIVVCFRWSTLIRMKMQ